MNTPSTGYSLYPSASQGHERYVPMESLNSESLKNKEYFEEGEEVPSMNVTSSWIYVLSMVLAIVVVTFIIWLILVFTRPPITLTTLSDGVTVFSQTKAILWSFIFAVIIVAVIGLIIIFVKRSYQPK